MSLTAKDVAEISRLLEESHFDSLELEIDGLKLSLRRAGAAPDAAAHATATEAAAPVASSAASVEQNAARSVRADTTVESRAAALDDPDQHRVTAPFLGTFYRAPKPGAPAFVAEGAAVEPDTVIGIIEVMKLMNSVRAGVAGKVVRILARDGALVEYGETLLLVSRTG
ncbi:MAG: acetyl-CoA carboxylase biotin carboxyl carrier protein [Sinobacteraceae bacterium]|nr:acetyl-CoA carboxylase biotin carboxyl carrier protein [Nevskiaceae bacterium]MBV9914001.1 acetyl-CoA carboxylase biotin carboxyl carrier protein [Nevskiaceae bacterium]